MRKSAIFFAGIVFLAGIEATLASELDALAISQNIQQFHMPYGTVLDPIFASADPASPDYSRIVSYTRAADSAVWTGHYLAAEAFRFQTTRAPDALANAWRAVLGIRALIDITGSSLLARCLVPVDSPYAAAIQAEEGGHGIFFGRLEDQNYFWIGNTSRDQYSGVMFGLGVAYDMIDDASMRDFIRADVTRILNYLMLRGWNVVMPDGRISTTFLHRPDQILSFLQIGRNVNPQRFAAIYALYRSVYAATTALPIFFENFDDHGSYFKFNLNYINLYHLIRLEENSSAFKQHYLNAYNLLRQRTFLHGNAHFNMLDRDLKGVNAGHDVETLVLLEQWLQRPRRDHWIDLRSKYAACGNDRACNVIPVNERVNTDFLWQRSPFLLFGGGLGTRETAGIDYILPYWMARRHGLTQ